MIRRLAALALAALLLALPAGAQTLSLMGAGSASAGYSGGGPCDLVSSCVVGYSFRLLRGAYAGQAVNLRRASDNTTQDCGFVNGGPDIGCFNTFCAATTCFATKMYDQSGNGLDASQGTNANQPQVTVVNGREVLNFVGLNGHVLASANDARTYAALTVAWVTSKAGASGVPFGTSDAGFTLGWFAQLLGAGSPIALKIANQSGSVVVQSNFVSNQGDGNSHAEIDRLSAAVGDLVEDGNALAVSSSVLGSVTTTTGQPIVLGDDLSAGDGPLVGTLQELVVWASTLTAAQRDAVNSSQRTYGGTP